MSCIALTDCLNRYLELKQALGRQYQSERWILENLVRFLDNQSFDDLTAQTFATWCMTLSHLKPGVRRYRLRIVRNFCLYRQRREPDCFIPDVQLFPDSHRSVQPYLFSDLDVARLLDAAATLKPAPGAPLRAEVFRLALILLYTTGLRRGELLRLVIGDFDDSAKTLLVRVSKFHKSRLLALSAQTADELERYLYTRRTQKLPVNTEIPLISNQYQGGRAYTGTGLGDTIHSLCRLIGLYTLEGRPPRLHDFRHSFAVNALLRWYQNGVDVQAKLPLLATYMGHVSIVSTHYYLQFVEPLATAASDRFASRYGRAVYPLDSGERL